MVGFPALVINPTLGIGLLGQASVSTLNYATKKRQIKNRPSYKNRPTYKVTGFNRGAHYTMQLEATRQIRRQQSEQTQDFARRHPKATQRILQGDTHSTTVNRKQNWFQRRFYSIHAVDNERLEVLDELKIRKKLKTALDDFNQLEGKRIEIEYKSQILELEEQERLLAEQLSAEELEFNDKLKDDHVIDVGDALFGIDLDDKTVQSQNRFMDAVEQIEESDTMTRDQKIKRIKRNLKDNKEELIKNQITQYFARRGINDITSTNLLEDDVIQIKQNMLGVLEEKGIIKKGEIQLKDDLISSEDVKNSYHNLNTNKEETNKSLEQRISADAILEYMQKNNITNPADLQSDVAKDGIFDIIKDKMMTDAQRVVSLMKGQDAIQLSDVMLNAVDENTQKVKKVKITGQKNKEKLVERQTNSQMNETKNQLEQAICADTAEGITSERTLDVLFTLSALGKNNCEEIERLGKNVKESEENQLKLLEFYQDGTRKLDSNRDGSRRFDEQKDGSRRLNDLFVDTKQRKLQRTILGPNNILDLINSVK